MPRPRPLHSPLAPVIGLGRLIGLTFAVIAPASSVFLTFGTAFQDAGTGIVLGYAAGSLLNLTMMLCYAEVGSRYPEAGGDYALAARALGRRVGSIYTVLFLVKGMAIPGLLALSTATYLHELWPSLPTMGLAFAIFSLHLLLASLELRTSSLVVNAMVAIEFFVFVLFMASGLHALHQPLQVLWHPIRESAPGVRLPVPREAWLAAATAALYGLNGPQSCLYYSEETRTAPRQLGRTILGTAVATILVELAAVVVGTLALPTLVMGHQSLPLAGVVEANLGGTWGRTLLLGGISIALFDTGLATTMSYGRIFFAIARDHQWPGALNRLAGALSRRGTPVGALVLLGAANFLMLALSGIHFLVTLGGTVLIVVYLGIALASLRTRIGQSPAPYAMPLWPLAPLAALAGLGLVLAQLARFQIIVTGLIVLLGVFWWWLTPQDG